MAQFIILQGVVDNGAKRSPLVPRHTAREIQFPRLSDTTIEVCVSLPNGQPVMVGSNLTFAARLDGCSGPTLTKAGTFSEGRGTLQIASQDTRVFCAGRLLYDVWLTVDAKKYQVVETGVLRLTPNIAANP